MDNTRYRLLYYSLFFNVIATVLIVPVISSRHQRFRNRQSTRDRVHPLQYGEQVRNLMRLHQVDDRTVPSDWNQADTQKISASDRSRVTDPRKPHRPVPQAMYHLYQKRLAMQGWSMHSPEESVRIVAVCHANWPGVKAATEALGFPLVLRENDSDATWNAIFLAALRHVNINKVLISGVPPGAADLAALLHADGRLVYLTYHGSFAQHIGYSYSGAESNAFGSALSALTKGHVSRLGLLKIEMINVVKSMGINAFALNNLVDKDSAWTAPKFRSFDGRLHIGILGRGSLGKNLMTQVVAACTLPNVVVHILKLEHEPSYLRLCKASVVRHDEMDHSAFRRLLAQMDVNVYASLHECQPMVALESIAAGVPCIISDTSTIYSYDARLEKQLVCNRPDSADAIQACIKSTIDVHVQAEFKDIVKSYINFYNEKACSSWEAFLQEKAVNLPSRFQRICRTAQTTINPLAQLVPDSEAAADRTQSKHHVAAANISQLAHCRRTALHGDAARSAATNGSIVLATYELDGVNPGGAGVLISALAKQLAASGLNVIVLADMPPPECRQWAADLASQNADLATRLRVVSVYDLGVSYDVTKGDEFVAKSILWADAVEAAAKKYDVAAVEFFEYAGPAAALMARKMQGTSSLPDRVAVYVRVHGSLEMIDAAEGVDPTPARLRMYMMERFAMAAADAVIYPSASMRKLYEASLGDLPRRSVVGTPPVHSILTSISPRPSRSQLVDLHCKPDSRKFNYLVLGKIQKIKNSALVARAAVQFLDSEAGRSATVTFVGSSFRNVETQADPLDEVLASIPSRLRNRIFICPRAGRHELNTLLPMYSASIVASAFESFNIVAHELYAAGLPLVISDFDAFADFFNPTNAYIFQRGNASDLAAAMKRAISTKITPVRMQYKDAVDAYRCLDGLDAGRGRPTVGDDGYVEMLLNNCHLF